MRASAAFHAALRGAAVERTRWRGYPNNQYDRADHWAWGELPVPADPRLTRPLARLAALRRPLPAPDREPALAAQLIHGDLGGGNVLIAPGEAPAIIDMTPFWRPAGFAAAVAAYWLGPARGDGAVLRHFEHLPHFDQLLVRAALRTLLSFSDPADVGDWPGYCEPAIDVICQRYG